jgi:hypothetical protein
MFLGDAVTNRGCRYCAHLEIERLPSGILSGIGGCKSTGLKRWLSLMKEDGTHCDNFSERDKSLLVAEELAEVWVMRGFSTGTSGYQGAQGTPRPNKKYNIKSNQRIRGKVKWTTLNTR